MSNTNQDQNLVQKPKHLGRSLLEKLLRFWGPGLVAIGLALLLLAVVESQLDQVTQAAPIRLPSFASAGTSSASASTSASPLASSAPVATYLARPKMGARIGTITLTSLNLSWPIYEGTNGAELHKGVGHYRSSVLPGENDNSVLSGHRATVFNRLGQLRVGQVILVRTHAGTFSYAVTGTRIVKRTNKTVIVHTDHAVLTLTTCYPFNALGTTTRAYIVSADLVK